MKMTSLKEKKCDINENNIISLDRLKGVENYFHSTKCANPIDFSCINKAIYIEFHT